MMKCVAYTLVAVALTIVQSSAKDWPMYRADAARSGYTDEALPDDLALLWKREAPHAPDPAWQAKDSRMPFDFAYHTVVAQGILVYGSSSDCGIHALDAATGQERWTFITDAPVRFSPVLWREKVYAISDDGYLYCLSLRDGALLWKKRGGPDDCMVLGNDRMISRRPARGGIAIRDDVVYWAAGIFPTEGIYLYALDAETGNPIWTNDTAGSLELDQPHGGARAKSGVSAQGYLSVTARQIVLPTGRAVPAAFNRMNGAFQYFHLQRYGQNGGVSIAASDNVFFNAGFFYETETGNQIVNAQADHVVLYPDGRIGKSGRFKVGVYEWTEVEKPDKKGNPVKVKEPAEQWSVESPHSGLALIAAGKALVCSGTESLCVVSGDTRSVVWSERVDGPAYGLTVADGRLYVSTDRGTIYCFGKNAGQPAVTLQPKTGSSLIPTDDIYAQTAEAIVRETGITEGYCVDLRCGNGALAYELAKRTNLKIVAVDTDPQNVTRVRENLLATGLYGARITVHHGDPARTNYPDYFADLVISGHAVQAGTETVAMTEANRLARPYGGVIWVGREGGRETSTRGELRKAGQWTHQYANPANTCSSEDRLVQAPLETLWFRDTDIVMPQRHGRGPAPLFYQGRLYMEGIHALRCVNAYNGRTLWEYPLPGILSEYNQDHLMGTAGTNSNYCVSEHGVFVRRDNWCLQLDLATGKEIRKFIIPNRPADSPGTWGYLATVGDILIGTVANEDHIVKWRYLKGVMGTQYTESSTLFAIDINTGECKWTYQAQDSIRHNAVAIGSGRLFLIDRPIAEFDRIDFDAAGRRGEQIEQQPGRLLAFDIVSGNRLWSCEENIYGTLLALSVEYDVLVMSYQPTRFRLDSEIGGRLAAFRASTGQRIWDVNANYESRPMIVDRRIYCQPGAWDLLSGHPIAFRFSRSYGCGILAGAADLMLFRSATLGYREFDEPAMENYGGVRVGCWVNVIPAGGIVLIPDTASGCKCSYLMLATMALHTQKGAKIASE